MNEQIKKIKIITAVTNDVAIQIENAVKEIKGVLDAKYDFDLSVLNYALDMWASDYDTMVAIMNVLNDEFNVDSEPYFDESEEVSDSDEFIYTPASEEVDDDNFQEDAPIDEVEQKRKETKYKFIEVGISVICIIIGLILQGVRKTEQYSPYLYTVAFSVVSYEFIFGVIAQIAKKQFNFLNIALFIALISSLILGIPLVSAVLMTIYGVANVLYELYKIDASKKYEFSFNLKESEALNKLNGKIIIVVFALCLVVAFVLPIFKGSYSSSLLQCAKNANIILLIFSITPSIFYVPLCCFLTYKFALKKGVKINDETAYKNVANAKKVAFLGQCVFVEDGAIKENAVGSVLELYDAGINETVLLSSQSKESTSNLRKELFISKSVSMLDSDAKINEVLALKNEEKSGGVIAVGCLTSNEFTTISLKQCDNCSLQILDGNLKKVPLSVKLLKRVKNICKQNAIAMLVAKIIVSILCAFGLITNPLVAIIPILIVSLLAILNTLRSCLEII